MTQSRSGESRWKESRKHGKSEGFPLAKDGTIWTANKIIASNKTYRYENLQVQKCNWLSLGVVKAPTHFS